MVRRTSTEWISGDDTLIELMHALTNSEDVWALPERPNLLVALHELLAWAGDSRKYEAAQHKSGWASAMRDVTSAADALGGNMKQVLHIQLGALLAIFGPDIGADETARRNLVTEAYALRQMLGQTATLFAAWKDLTSACSQPTRPMKTVAARRDVFWMVVRATDRNPFELSRSLTSVLTGDPIQARLARHELGELGDSDLEFAVHRTDPLLDLSGRLDLAAKLLVVAPMVKTHVVWLAYKRAYLNSTGQDLGSIRLYWAPWVQANLQSEESKQRLPRELATREDPLIIPDGQDVVLARVDLGAAAFPDAIRVAGERLDALLDMSTLGAHLAWERLSGHIHAVDGRVVSHKVFQYEKSAPVSRYAEGGTAAQFARMAPRVVPHLPVQDSDMKDIVAALSWWRVGHDHPTAAAVVLNVRVLELVASRLGTISWTTYLENYIKNIWLHSVMLDVLFYALHEALHYRRLPPELLARQRELFLEANTYKHGQRGFDVRAAACHLNEIIGFIPSNLPMARDLRSIKKQTANANALNAWRADLEQVWADSVLRLERVRNAITHGGPFTEEAVLLVHPFSQQVSVWALWECLEGFLDGKTLAQTHVNSRNRWDQWHLRLQTATSADGIFLS